VGQETLTWHRVDPVWPFRQEESHTITLPDGKVRLALGSLLPEGLCHLYDVHAAGGRVDLYGTLYSSGRCARYASARP
jgi:hypothetical protein